MRAMRSIHRGLGLGLALGLAAAVGVGLTAAGCGGDDGARVCGQDDTAPGPDDPCPTACTGGCAGGVCTIQCADHGCSDGTIVCPPDYACRVVCDGLDACDTSTIQCPDSYECTVACQNGVDACGDVYLECGEGSCTMQCAADTCIGAAMKCGTGACTATCSATSRPTQDCGQACDCVNCQ